MINHDLLNTHTHDAKHVLSFATFRKYRYPSESSRSLIISPVRQAMSSNASLALFAKSHTSPEQGDENVTISENSFGM